ncbi:hypothetical protein [Legionella feeleii]|uniref:hypothetical protein n=1 Tax=Legionella feeleii TaxID=453 RepID=UPI0015F125E0|nr:hypothetical protein [Legionella feeleii]
MTLPFSVLSTSIKGKGQAFDAFEVSYTGEFTGCFVITLKYNAQVRRMLFMTVFVVNQI